MKPLVEVRNAIERRDLTGAYVAALVEWRARRSSEVADLIHTIRARLPDEPVIAGPRGIERWLTIEAKRDPLDVGRQVRFLRADLRQKVWRIGLLQLEKRGVDPIMARELAEALRTTPWRSPAASGIYRAICALVAAGGTPADAAPLRAGLAALEQVASEQLATTVRTLFAKTIDALEAPRAAPDANHLAEVHAMLDRDARASSDASTRTETLLAAVYANLADDGPRLVLADHLVELGDPRGELIALQCQRAPLTAPQTARARKLVETYGTRWLAELGSHTVLKSDLAYERGFVAQCRVYLTARDRTIGHRLWSTVRAAELVEFSRVEELIDPVAVSLRTLTGLARGSLHAIRACERELPLERIGLRMGIAEDLAVLAELDRTRLPALRELDVRQPATSAAPRVLAAVRALAPLDRVYVQDPPHRWLELLGNDVRELVVYDRAARFRITRDQPQTAHVELAGHAWEYLDVLDVTGISKLVVAPGAPSCKFCKEKVETPEQLARRFGIEVELG